MRMIARAAPESREEAKVLWKEAYELQRIFIMIVKKSRLHGQGTDGQE